MTTEDFVLKYSWILAVCILSGVIITGYLDVAGLVYKCPYCRVQRVVVGLLAIMLLLPVVWPSIQFWISIPFAFFGLDISGDQIFLVIKNGNLPNMNSNLAMLAFLGIVAVEIAIFVRTTKAQRIKKVIEK